jgi:hypothetical protein
MTVLLAKSNLLRREPWRVETLIVEDEAGLHVVKRRPPGIGPAATAPLQLGTLAERHARLAAAIDAFALPRILHAGEHELRLEHVAGQTSLAKLERCLYERRFAAAQAEIDGVLALLQELPGVLADPHDHAGFAAAFDPDDRAGRLGAEPCILPGLYDFGLGNLVTPADGGPRVLVDWEWTLPWPMPVAFVRFVVVRNAAEYLQPLIRALTSDALPGLVFFDDVVIPEAWAVAAGLDPHAVRRFVAFEAAFQGWIHVMHRPVDQYVIHDEPRRITCRQDENATLLAERLGSELAAERREARVLREQLATRDIELLNTRRVLSDLDGVRFSVRHLRTLLVRRFRGRRP